MSLEPGNLLGMARLNFRVKCNNHFRDSAPLGRCLLFYESRHFFMECACSYELYMIKWQAILLRIYSFPPRTHERIFFYPGVASLPLINFKCMICEKYCNEFSMLCRKTEIRWFIRVFFYITGNSEKFPVTWKEAAISRCFFIFRNPKMPFPE